MSASYGLQPKLTSQKQLLQLLGMQLAMIHSRGPVGVAQS